MEDTLKKSIILMIGKMNPELEGEEDERDEGKEKGEKCDCECCKKRDYKCCE